MLRKSENNGTEDLSNVTVAIISLIGSGSNVFMANKLSNYRIEKLEELVKERSSAIEKIYNLERDNAVIHEKINELDNRISKIERG